MRSLVTMNGSALSMSVGHLAVKGQESELLLVLLGLRFSCAIAEESPEEAGLRAQSAVHLRDLGAVTEVVSSLIQQGHLLTPQWSRRGTLRRSSLPAALARVSPPVGARGAGARCVASKATGVLGLPVLPGIDLRPTRVEPT
jgi:hypothetical protein